jgi:RecJ-like exonuclease
MGKGGYPRPAPCGVCQGEGIIFVQGYKIVKKKYLIMGEWTEFEIEEEVVKEVTCPECHGRGR